MNTSNEDRTFSDDRPRAVTFVAWGLMAILLLVAFGNCPRRHFMTPFREGQTALLAAQLAHPSIDPPQLGSWWLRTPTPVFGYPWDLPLEYPLYQQIVAGLAISGLQLDVIGRLVNAAFTVGAILLLVSMGGVMGLDVTRMRLMALLALLSPLYFGYGGAFLIEGCALFFAMLWLWCTLRAFRGGTGAWIGAVLASVTAGVVKPTTWVPAAVAVGVFLMLHFLRCRCLKQHVRWYRYLGVIAIMVLTVVVVREWVRFSDEIKELNPLGAQLTSGRVAAWSYGTIKQKFSPAVWLMISVKTLVMAFGLAGVMLPLATIPAFRRLRNVWDESFAWEGAALMAALAAAAAAPVVFTNLHLQHDYYQFANGIYLWVALAIGLEWLARTRNRRLVANIVGILVLSCGLTTIGYVLFRKALRDPADDAVLAALDQLPSGRPVAYVGFDYTGKLPYYSTRPALMTITSADISSGRLDESLKLNRALGYGAVVAAGPQYLEIARHAADELAMKSPTVREIFPRTFIVVPAADSGRLFSGASEKINPAVGSVIAEVSGKVSGYRSITIEKTAGGWPVGVRIVLKRRDQVFVFRSRDFSLTRIKSIE